MLPKTYSTQDCPSTKNHRIPNAHSELGRVRFHLAAEPRLCLQGGVSLGEGAVTTPSRPPASEGSDRKSEGESRGCRGTARAAQGGSVPWQPVCGGACHPTAQSWASGQPGSGRTQTGGGCSVSELGPTLPPRPWSFGGPRLLGPAQEVQGRSRLRGQGKGHPGWMQTLRA